MSDGSVPYKLDMHWLVPDLTLEVQLRRERDRRAAAHKSLDELAVIADKLIVDWYQHTTLIDNLLGRVRVLEVELALAQKPETNATSLAPKDYHYKWAAELLDDLRTKL